MNFLFGLQNIAINIQDSIEVLASHQVVWGFALGFAASTIVHLVVITDNPRELASIITKDAAQSYQQASETDDAGTYKQSYAAYQQQYGRVKSVFYATLLVFLVVSAIALMRIWG
jgi:hypothetical protein